MPNDALFEILGHLNTKGDIMNSLAVSKEWFSVVHKLKFACHLFETDAIFFENLAMETLKSFIG